MSLAHSNSSSDICAKVVPPPGTIPSSTAALVAFSRVYVGVHYPADILFGGLLGYGLGWIALTFWVMVKIRGLKAEKNWVKY